VTVYCEVNMSVVIAHLGLSDYALYKSTIDIDITKVQRFHYSAIMAKCS